MRLLSGLSGTLRGVFIDVVLPSQVSDLKHQLIGQLAQTKPLIRRSSARLHPRSACQTEPQWAERFWGFGIGGLHRASPENPHRDDRRTGPDSESRRSVCPLWRKPSRALVPSG